MLTDYNSNGIHHGDTYTSMLCPPQTNGFRVHCYHNNACGYTNSSVSIKGQVKFTFFKLLSQKVVV